MKDSSTKTDGMSFTTLNDYLNGMYCYSTQSSSSPYYTFTTSVWPTQLETNSNELKINIKKSYIKFNFNL